jgi:hypothetical protein
MPEEETGFTAAAQLLFGLPNGSGSGTQTALMRTCWTSIWIVGLAAMLLPGLGCRKAPPPSKPDTLARWHFAGSDVVNATTNGGTLKSLLTLPESHALCDQTLDKLARAPFAHFKSRWAYSTNDCADLLRPLLTDLIHAESYFEMRGVSNQPPEWTLALRLSAEQADVWRTNLATTVQTWTQIQPTNATVTGYAGWRVKKHQPPDLIGVVVAEDWMLVGAGHGTLALQEEFAQRIRASGRPVAAESNNWLTAMLDWPRLPAQPFWLAALRLPRTELTVSARDENLQSRVELVFPQPHGWVAEPWLFPTNTIREPVVSFAALQGFGHWLRAFVQALGLKLDPVPNQLCTWALAEIPFQTFLAMPHADATNAMAGLCEQLPPLFHTNTQGLALGSWRAATNGQALVWEGMPFFGGFMRPAHEETESGFLLAGLFPNTPRKVPPPPELFAQVAGRTNLVYYDWEIGAERLPAWRNMAQLALLLADKAQLGPESATAKWMEAVAPKIGNIGTTITVSGPDRMTLVRQSPYGFTSIETVLLANWLESVTFPWGYELPPTPKRKRAAATPEPGY